jgi:hypothetical protein
MASIAESKLGYLVSQKRREPSLRRVLLHAGFLERVLDHIDAYTPDHEDEPMIDEPMPEVVPEQRPEIHPSLSTIVEVDEMEVDSDSDDEEADEDEDDDAEMPPLKRTISHRPGSPVSSSDEESDDDEELPSPPAYTPPQDHPLINLFEVREKARRDDLSNHYHFNHSEENLFLVNNSLAVAA